MLVPRNNIKLSIQVPRPEGGDLRLDKRGYVL